ncbi:hypothetical protein [Sphingobacterium multivorum]|uniref:hypothetical protein n=1 Tax=Sphingobacterium multivorum TaxID=28454 RepID=UPI0028AE6C61|nr:hypothetical protein [Sphingobacterium multivorum]
MANYCSNSVTFSGANSDKALAYCASLEYNSPPFLDISIYRDSFNFESRWSPPIAALNRLAEQFDVSYNLTYRPPYEDRAFFEYICLQQVALEPSAEHIRQVINKALTAEQLKEAWELVDGLLRDRSFNLPELGLFACLLQKRTDQLTLDNSRIQLPWESDDTSTDRSRQR